jgi:hypothetical protein
VPAGGRRRALRRPGADVADHAGPVAGHLQRLQGGCRGRKAGPDILLSGFRQNLPELVKIGGIYLIGTFAVLGLTALADDGILAELMLGKRKLDEATAEDPQLRPVAAHRHPRLDAADDGLLVRPAARRLGPHLGGKAMFFSFVACCATGGPSWPTRSG